MQVMLRTMSGTANGLEIRSLMQWTRSFHLDLRTKESANAVGPTLLKLVI
jgi:hypothetical protein